MTEQNNVLQEVKLDTPQTNDLFEESMKGFLKILTLAKRTADDVPGGPLDSLSQEEIISFGEVGTDLTPENRRLVSDAYIVRFLREHNFDIPSTVKAITQYIEWRHQFKPQELIRRFSIPRSLQHFWPGRYHGYDRQGRPLYIWRPASLDTHGLLNSRDSSRAQHVKFHAHTLEMGEYYMREVREQFHRTVGDTMVVIYDMKDISVTQYEHKFLGFVMEMFALEQQYYPGRTHAVIFVNINWVFKKFWKMATPFLSKRIRKLIHTYKDDFHEALAERIDPAMLPRWLGGTCTACHGGCVPAGGTVPDEVLSELGTGKMKIVRTVKHQTTFKCSLPVLRPDIEVRIQFRTKANDIDFAMLFTQHEDEGLHEYDLYEMERYQSHKEVVEVQFLAKPGMYTFVWSNNYSAFTDKELMYRIGTRPASKMEPRSDDEEEEPRSDNDDVEAGRTVL